MLSSNIDSIDRMDFFLTDNRYHMKKRLWHIDAAASWLFASVLVACALPVHATERKWFEVSMDKSASLAELCSALPSGVSPEALLEENVQGGGKLDYTNRTDEGDVKVFSTKSGSYAFATTPKACTTFRQNMMAAAEQRKLSPLWLVADGASNTCRPLTDFFPSVGSVPGAAVPTVAQHMARMVGMQPKLEFLSPRFASLTVTLPNKNKKIFNIFSKKSECAVYLGGLHQILQNQSGNIGKGKQPQKWYAPNGSFSDCIVSDGPAGRIDTFGNDEKPVVTEHKDKYNVLYKVEVTKYNRGGTTTNWMYYKKAETCIAEEVESNKTVAEKYR